jgi:protein-disulfide isomerase
VFQSEDGTVFGLPVAIGGAVWSGLVLLLSAWGMRQPRSETAARVAGYVFVLSVAGLAAVFYFAYASFFVLRQACPLCMTMYASVIGIFLISASAAGKLSALPSRFGQDLASVGQSTTAATLAGIWVVASLALILTFPREQAVAAEETTAANEPAAPIETLTPEQTAEWQQWFDAQMPVPEAMPTDPAVKVLVMKFNDYQCPACRATWSLYRDILAKYESAYPGVFKYESRDFPLEPECGAGGVHAAACEAAAAVRMAREKNRHKELEAALFTRQSPSMTRDEVKDALEEVADISGSDFDARYAKTLEAVRADAQLGQKLGVSGTPTFFVNGVKVPTVRPAYFDATIAYALRKAGVGE